MNVFYSTYQLTPLKKANRLSCPELKDGVYLKAVDKDSVTYADYFPHIPLGDRGVDQFLQEFKQQGHEYDQKILNFLKEDLSYQNLTPKKFFNHQLWTGSEELESNTIKYKLQDSDDRNFMRILEDGRRLRLDCNALFSKEEYGQFLRAVPSKFHSLIDYVEDPLGCTEWDNLPVPSARDFVEGSPFDFYIYKPNCEFLPKTGAQIIYSSYLGGSLGQWHAYCEMIQSADLSQAHGIVTSGFYQEEKEFLTGSFQQGFIADVDAVKGIYRDLSVLNWKPLCSM